MRKRVNRFKISILIGWFIFSYLFTIPVIQANPPTLEEAQFYSRIASALFEAYVMHSDDPDSLYIYCENTLQDIRNYISIGNYGQAIASAQEMIDEILILHPGFTIFISDDGIHLLQTPTQQQLIQGERGYVPFAIFNEISQNLNVSISSSNSVDRFITPQIIPAHKGTSTPAPYIEFASAVIPTIDVVCTTAGTQTVPLHVDVAEAETGDIIDSLDTSFDINVSALSASQNLFSYLPSRQSPDSDFSTSMAILDVDGNGKLDVYFGNYMRIGKDNYPEPAENVLWRNRGEGSFKRYTLDSAGDPKGTRDVTAADVDGDGSFDHVIDANMDVRIGDGKNVIRSLPPDLTAIEINQTPHDAVNIIAEDINLNDTDSKPQLLVCNIDDRIELYLNDPLSPTGFEANPHWVSGGPYGHMGLGDVNNDGVKDLAVSTAGQVAIYRGYANGSSDIWFDISTGGLLWLIPEKTKDIKQLLFVDLDNDNDQDFIIVASEVYVYLNNSGSLEEATGWPLEFKYQMPSCADVGDINNDGIKDIAIGFYTSFDPLKRLLGGENRVYLGTTDGLGNFTFNTTPAWVAYYSDKTTDIKLANLDEDNLLDLVVANDGQEYIYFNKGSLGFSPVLPKDPTVFYKGNIYSQVNAPPATPAPNYSQPTNVGNTIGVSGDISKTSDAEQLQENFEYIGARVAGFWSGFKSEFEGMIYFNKIDAEIAAVIAGGAERLMLFNPGIGEKWAAASDNGKTFDNIDTYAWVAEKFCQRYGPSGLLAQNYGWNGIEVMVGVVNEPECDYEDTAETTVEKQAKLFDVAKNIDPNIIVTTSNHGGGALAIENFNLISQAIGLGPYDQFDIARVQRYDAGLSKRGAGESDYNWYCDEFYNLFDFPELGGLYLIEMLTDPTLPWAVSDYGWCVGEGNNVAETTETYPPNQVPEGETPTKSQSQLGSEVVGTHLRNASYGSQAAAMNNCLNVPAAKLALKVLIETLDGYTTLDLSGPQLLNDGKVIVYKFENTTDNSWLYAVRKHPGYYEEPVPAQAITLDLHYPDSTVVITNMFEGLPFTGDDVMAINEDFINILPPEPVGNRWVTVEDVTHGQYNQSDVLVSSGSGEVTVNLPNDDWYYIREFYEGTNIAPSLGPITTPQTVSEGEVLTIPLSATDPNTGDVLTFSYSSEPALANAHIVPINNSSANFILEPDYTQSDTYIVTFVVTDQGGLSDDQEVVINILDVNQTPEFNPISPQRVEEGEPLEFDVSATDPDGDDLYFEVESAPNGFRLEQTSTTTATCMWEPDFTQSGNYTAVISVTDREIPTPITVSVPIEVVNVNQSPELHPMGPYSTREGILLEFTSVATDPDGDPITFSSSNLPNGATLDSQTGVFSWMPDYNQGAIPFEEYSVTIVVRDDQGGQDSESVIINVEDINREPVLDPLPQEVYTVNEADTLVIDLDATDPDEGDALTFTYEATEGMEVVQFGQINNREARFSYAPDYDQAGTYHVRFTVMDQGGLRDDQTITIEVENVNRPPVVEPIPAQTVPEAPLQPLTFTVNATDPDSDPLVYDVNDPPEGFRIDAQTGECSWEPDYNQAGSYTVEITVSDHEATVTVPVHIEVTNTNRPPELHPLGPFSVREGVLLEFTAVAVDPDGDLITYSSPNLPNGATLNSQTGEFSWTPNYNQSGLYTITIIVSDGLGGQDEEDVDIEVLDAGGRR